MSLSPSSRDSNEQITSPPRLRKPSRDEMQAVFIMCRHNQWNSVLNCIRGNHLIPVTSMTMDNHISTTILHQAITSKGDVQARARIIQEILEIAPEAARIKNGYGSLPLHVISQRNTKLDARTKEFLISEIVNANKEALVTPGGVGRRTPLHIIFTDYVSPGLTQTMIESGKAACFMKDKKGYLPAHVACSRHCSPSKLQMLLEVNPAALIAETKDKKTLLSLATGRSTASHPNFTLINEIKKQLAGVGPSFPFRVSSNSSDDASDESRRRETPKRKTTRASDKPKHTRVRKRTRKLAFGDEEQERESPARSSSDDTFEEPQTRATAKRAVAPISDASRRIRTVSDEADLLLHFSRYKDESVKLIAKV